MQKHKMLITLGLTLFLAVPLLMGCGGQSPDQVAQKYVNAQKASDVQPLVTKLAWEKMSEDMDVNQTTDDMQKMTVGESTITGDNATVELTSSEGETSDLLMRKVEGDWKIYGMQVKTPMGNFTVDFEHPEKMMGNMGEAIGAAMGEAMMEMGEEMERSMEGLMEGMGEGIQFNFNE